MYSIGLRTCKTPPCTCILTKSLPGCGVALVWSAILYRVPRVGHCGDGGPRVSSLEERGWLVPLIVQSSSQKWHSVLTWGCSRLVLDRGYRRGCDLASCSVTRGGYAGGLRGSVSRGLFAYRSKSSRVSVPLMRMLYPMGHYGSTGFGVERFGTYLY